MKNSRHVLISILIIGVLFQFSCSDNIQYDLLIKNATILDVETREKKEKQSLLIKDGKILKITDKANYKTKKEIDAQGRLVTPGFIDTHIHPTDVFGDYKNAPINIPKDSADHYRKTLSNEYLPYGVTTALIMGHPENWLEVISKWNTGNTSYTDFYTCGGALISKEEREPYIGHLTVEGRHQAKQKVIDFYNKGLRHLKVYYRLREPEFSVIMKTSDSLNMKVYGHIGDFDPSRMSIQETLEKGLRNYEHIATFPLSLMKTASERNRFTNQFESLYGSADTIEKLFAMFLEAFRYIDEYNSDDAVQLIQQLAKNKTSFSTTIGYIHQQFMTSHYFQSTSFTLTDDQIKRSKENFKIMMKYLKRMSDAGIPIRIATDTKFGGKVFLTELKILSEYGFSTEEIFKIATQNGAQALGLEKEIGTIENNKKANLVIWHKSPFDNTENFFSRKIIIKEGEEIN